jgi:CheY-like chemotaxis protein
MGRSGTGLGMAVVWSTMKDHRGYIDVESTEGKGTTFTLYFPATREQQRRERSTKLDNYRGNGERILVVDDAKEQQEIASEMLTKLGYSVTCVSSGEEAVTYLQKCSADLVVLDMIMDPGMDGLETYKRILEIYPGQKAVITSGFSETDRIKEALKIGVGTYIRKPFLIEDIAGAVKVELNNYERHLSATSR